MMNSGQDSSPLPPHNLKQSKDLLPNSKKIKKERVSKSTKQRQSSKTDQKSSKSADSDNINKAESPTRVNRKQGSRKWRKLSSKDQETIIVYIIRRFFGKCFKNATDEEILEILRDSDGNISWKDFILNSLNLDELRSKFNSAIAEIVPHYDHLFIPSVETFREWRRNLRRWIESLGKPDGRGNPIIPKDKRDTFRLVIVLIFLKYPCITQQELLEKIAKAVKYFGLSDDNQICKNHWWQLVIERDPIIKRIWLASMQANRALEGQNQVSSSSKITDNRHIYEALLSSLQKFFTSKRDERVSEEDTRIICEDIVPTETELNDSSNENLLAFVKEITQEKEEKQGRDLDVFFNFEQKLANLTSPQPCNRSCNPPHWKNIDQLVSTSIFSTFPYEMGLNMNNSTSPFQQMD